MAKPKITLLLFIFIILSSFVYADSIWVQPDETNISDTYVDAGSPNDSYGNANAMYLAGDQLTLLNFSYLCYSIPNNRHIENVTITFFLFQVQAGSQPYHAYAILSDWNETLVTYNLTNITSPFFNMSNDLLLSYSAIDTTYSNFSLNASWFQNECNNIWNGNTARGIMINGTGIGSVANTGFRSSSWGTPSQRPQYYIIYTEQRIYFYDEYTNTLINDTLTVYLEKTGFSLLNTSVTQNPYIVTGIPNGTYTVKVSSTKYPERQYFDVDFINKSTNLNTYSINSSIGTEITFDVMDSSSVDIENAIITYKRFINGSWIIVAEEETDYAGQAKLYLDPNYEYNINFTHSNYKTKVISLEPSSTSYNIFLEDLITTTPNIVTSIKLDRLTNFTNLSYTESTKVVNMSWFDVYNYSTNFCLDVVSINFTYYHNCSTSNSSKFYYFLNQSLNITYTAVASATVDGRLRTLYTIPINLAKIITTVFGKDSIVFALLLFLILFSVGIFSPYAAIVAGIGGLYAAYLFGILLIGSGTMILLAFLGVVLIIGINKARQQG